MNDLWHIQSQKGEKSQPRALNHVKCNREGACSIMKNVTQFKQEVGLHGKDGHELPKTISQGVDEPVCKS